MVTTPFTPNPNGLIFDGKISNGAFRVYQAIRSHKHHKTGRCDPGIEKLAERLGMGESTVYRHIQHLRQVGWIAKQGHSFDCRDRAMPPETLKTENPKFSVERTSSLASENFEQPYLFNEPDASFNKKGVADAAAVVSTTPQAAAAAALPLSGEEKENTSASASPAPPAEVVVASQGVDIPGLAGTMVAKLSEVHPQPGPLLRPRQELEAILRAAADVQTTAHLISERHAEWMQHWATLGQGKFIPMLFRWIRERWWESPAPIRKPVVRETWEDIRKRKVKESDESYYRMLAEHEMWDALREYGQDPEVWRVKIQAA